jgi:hypothetical protein
MIMLHAEDKVMDVDDMGVTIRSMLAVAAEGYALTGQRKWGIRYKGVVIGNVQCASIPRVPARSPARITSKPL